METALIKRAIYNKDKDDSEPSSKMSIVKLAEAGTGNQDSLNFGNDRDHNGKKEKNGSTRGISENESNRMVRVE